MRVVEGNILRCARRARRAAAALGLLLAMNADTSAVTSSWTSAVSGNWNDPNRWTPFGIPPAANDVLFNVVGAAGYTVTVTPGSAAASLTVDRSIVTFNSAGNNLAVSGLLKVGSLSGVTAEARFTGGAATFGGGIHYIGGQLASGNSTGTLVVDNADLTFSSANSNDRIRIGSGTTAGVSQGTLSIINGGTLVTNRRIHVADENESVGAIQVIGLGSQLQLTDTTNSASGQLVLGDGVNATVRTSTMSISNAGYVETDKGFVGSNTNAYGQVTIGGISGGVQATWKVRQALDVGGVTGSPARISQGVINLNTGGLLDVRGKLTLFNNNATALNLSGGELRVGSIDTSSSPSRLNWTTGIMQIDDQDLIVGSAGPLGNVSLSSSLQALSVIDRAGGTVTGKVSTAVGGILSVTGGDLTVRTLDLTNGGLNFTDGFITVDGGALIPGATLSYASNAFSIDAPRLTLINAATLSAPATNLNVGGGGDSGIFELNSGATATVHNATFLGNLSELIISGAGSQFTTTKDLTVTDGASLNLSAGAVLEVQGNFNFDGSISMSSSTIRVLGSYNQTGGGIGGGGQVFLSGGTIGGTLSGSLELVLDAGNTTIQPDAFVSVGAISFIGNSSPVLTLGHDGVAGATVQLNGSLTFSGTAGTGEIRLQGPAGDLDLGSGVRTFSINNGSNAVDMLIGARITNGQINKSGAGTLRLTFNGNQQDKTTISNGVVQVLPGALSTGDVVFSGGTLALRSDNANASWPVVLDASAASASVSIDRDTAGGGSAGTFSVNSLKLGAFSFALSGANRDLAVTGPVILSGDGTIDNARLMTLSGVISGTGFKLTKNGPGTLSLSGASANTHTGITRVNAGLLQLGKNINVVAVPGNFEVFGGTARLMASEQIANAAILTVSNSGTVFDLNGFNETIGSLSIVAGGSVQGSGVLQATGAITTSTSGVLSARSALLQVTAASISNNGIAEARDGGTLRLVTLPGNFSGGTLTGGTWRVIGASILRMDGANITTLAANLTLDGAAASIRRDATADAIGSLGTIGPAGALTLLNGRTFTIAGPLSNAGTLSVGEGSVLSLSGPLVSTGAINLTGSGKIDLKTHPMLFDTSAGGAAAALAQISASIATARGGASLWQGPGLTTSSFTPFTGLATMLNDNGAGQPVFATFAGISADASSVLVKYTYNGDADFDGIVSIDDYFRIDLGRALGKSGYVNGDFNYSGGAPDADDYFLIDAAFIGQSGPLSDRPYELPVLTAIPEPASLLFIGCGMVLFLRRRCR